MCLTVGVWMIHAVHMFGWNGINSFFHESFEVLFLNFAVKRYGVVTLSLLPPKTILLPLNAQHQPHAKLA